MSTYAETYGASSIASIRPTPRFDNGLASLHFRPRTEQYYVWGEQTNVHVVEGGVDCRWNVRGPLMQTRFRDVTSCSNWTSILTNTGTMGLHFTTPVHAR